MNVLRQLRLRPIVTGIIVDNLSTFAIALLYGLARLLLVIAITGDGAPDVSLVTALTPAEEATLFAIGAMMTGLGGYVAARLAGTAHLAQAAAVGVAALLLSAIEELLPSAAPDGPSVATLVGFIVVIPAATLGGWFARAQEAREGDAATPDESAS